MANATYPDKYLLQGQTIANAFKLSGFGSSMNTSISDNDLYNTLGFVPGLFHISSAELGNLPSINPSYDYRNTGYNVFLANGNYINFGWNNWGSGKFFTFSFLKANDQRLTGYSSSNWYLSNYSDFYVGIFKDDSDRLGMLFIGIQSGSNRIFSYIDASTTNDLTNWINGSIAPDDYIGTGGGATHIAKVPGLLSALSGNLSDILIVAGGGGGGLVAEGTPTAGANGGGISGSGNNSADQSTGYAFGQGEASGGGGGLYGGYKAANSDSGGAGSGYIGNALLDAKKMVGFNVPTSDVASTKTESVNVYNATAEENKPKAGNGFAKITWLRDLA